MEMLKEMIRKGAKEEMAQIQSIIESWKKRNSGDKD